MYRTRKKNLTNNQKDLKNMNLLKENKPAEITALTMTYKT